MRDRRSGRQLWLGFALLLLVGCSRDPRPTWITVAGGTLPLTMVESGEVAAVRSQLVRPPQEWSGSLVIVDMVPEGTLVAEGDTVVQLDASALLRERTDLEQRIRSLTAQREGVVADQSVKRQALADAVAAAHLSREQAELQLQKLAFESQVRQQEARLAASRAVNALQEAQTKLAAQAVLDSLALAKADLELASASSQMRALDERRRAMVLRAPLAGLVVYHEQEDRDGRRIKPRIGDVVDPWRPVVQIPDLSQMQVELMIHEVDRHRVHTGRPVRIRLEAYPEVEFTGRLASIARLATEIEEGSGVRGFAAVVELEGRDARLRPGMSAVVEIQLGEVAGAVLVPRTALGRGEEGPVVYPRDGWPRPRPVRVAAQTPLLAAVVEGLVPGAELAAAPPSSEAP